MASLAVSPYLCHGQLFLVKAAAWIFRVLKLPSHQDKELTQVGQKTNSSYNLRSSCDYIVHLLMHRSVHIALYLGDTCRQVKVLNQPKKINLKGDIIHWEIGTVTLTFYNFSIFIYMYFIGR